MATNLMNVFDHEDMKHGYDKDLSCYVIVHPLDDRPEEKIDTAALGPMPMTATVRWSLTALRAYLLLMFVLVIYHVLQIALTTK